MSQDFRPQKKMKFDRVRVKNYSDLMRKDFEIKDLTVKTFLYQVKRCESFALLLPLTYPENMEIEFIKNLEISLDLFELLKKFQNKFWHDLKKEKICESGQLSEVNYLVVPVKNGEVNLAKVKKCFGDYGKAFEEVADEKKQNCLWINSKDNSKVKIVSKVPDNTYDFFKILIGPNHPDFSTYVDQYKGKSVLSLIQEENIPIQSLQKFPHKSLSLSLSQLVFIKNTRSVVYNPDLYSKQKFFSVGTPLVLTSQLFKFYLKKSEFNQVFDLIDSLIKLEHLSCAVYFSSKIGYKGKIDLLRKAMTSSSADNDFNYESLETVGDTVLKFIVSLSLYLHSQDLNENECTRLRGFLVSNKTLTEIGNYLDLKYFIRTAFPTHFKYIPAYYYNSKIKSLSAFEVEQNITDSLIADFVEALIGCVYLGEGLESAANFIWKIGLISNCADLVKYLTKEKVFTKLPDNKEFQLYTEFKTLFNGKVAEIKAGCIEIGDFSYKFKVNQDLEKALTHSSVNEEDNYETLEFLGDAVLDLWIVSNLYLHKEFEPWILSSLKQIMACNQNLCCVALATKIFRFIRTCKGFALSSKDVDGILEKDILRHNVFKLNLDKQLGDVVEALIGAVFVDSKSVLMVKRFIDEIFLNQLGYILCYYKEYFFISYFSKFLNDHKDPSNKLMKRI